MKCKNCGYELRETDKFCNECGAKVEKEQVSETIEADCSVNSTNTVENNDDSNKNENPLQVIQIKCSHCGQDTPQNQKYCKNCGAELNSNTPPIYKNPKIWIIFAIVFILAIFFIVLAISPSTDNHKSFTYKNYTLGNMSYKAPDTWEYSDYDDGNYHYDSKNNLLTVYATDFDEEINEENSESFISGLVYADGMSEVTEISKDFTYICSKKALHYIYTCEISNKDMYMNVYAFSKDGYLYGFSFGSYGHKQSDEFNATETDIIDSIRFDGVSKYITPTSAEPTTEEPTTEEPTTEKPTEPPVNSYSEGQYKVGTDIPSGQYILYNISTSKAYYCISSDANGNDIIANNNFKSQNYITVHDGEYLELVRCEAFSVKDKKEVDTSSGYLTEGHYLVGEDLPAGEYKLTCTDSAKGYYAVCSDDLSDDIIANDNFKGDCYVSVSDGQYLEIVRCKLLLN